MSEVRNKAPAETGKAPGRLSSAARRLGVSRRRRVPTILQIEAVECGAASLGMILAAHGRWIPLIELRRICGISRDGSKASNLVRAGRELGYEVRGLKREPDKLADLPMPAIIFVHRNHFVVLEGFSRKGAHINDPAGGRATLSAEEFDKIYSGIVLTFEPTAAFERQGAAPRIIGPLLRTIAGGMSPALLTVLAGSVLVIPSIFLASYNRIFVDDFVIDGQKDWFFGLMAAMVLTLIVQVFLIFLEERTRIALRNRIAVGAAAGFVWRMLRLPVTFFSQRHPGSISSRVDMSDQLAELATGQMLAIPIAATSMLIFSAAMLIYSPALTAISASAAIAATLLLLVMQSKLAAVERKGASDNLKLSARTMQGLAMIEVMKGSGTEAAYLESWSGQQALVVNQRQHLGRMETAFVAAPDFLSHLGELLVIVVAGLLVMRGDLTLGMLVAFLMLQGNFFGPMKTLLHGAMQLSKARATLDQFDDVHQHPLAPEFKARALAPDVDRSTALGRVRKLEGLIEIRDLTFGYNRLDAPLVSNFSVTLKPGSRVALVGGSGSGKSTIGRLVSGLLEPWSGEIRIDGRALDEIPRDLLRNSMSVVDQDIAMFSGTVRDNITLWDDTMPEAQTVQAARDAMIHGDIVQRMGSYHGQVEEGGRNFSGGQRQRLEIARALVTTPSILVLDEATSALDPIVEKAVMDNLRRRGCTCIIIAHRLSTIRDCDEIIVMERGRIVERGTHEAMARADGPYRRLIET